MGLRGINTTDFYNKPVNAQSGSQALDKKKILFTNAADMGKALANGSINVDGVSVDLSEEAIQALKEAREKFYSDRDAETERYVAEYNSHVAKQQQEAAEDMSEDMAKALVTARRIANGDIVPAIDEKKLLEYNEELYQMAKTAAMLHQMEEHRKHKSLYGDEEDREYTDPEAETAPQQKYAVEVEVSLGDTPAVESITEGELIE